MSRIGKQIITIPEKTEVKKDGVVFSVKGPLGELARTFRDDITVVIEGSTVTLAPNDTSKSTNMLWGTYAAHIKNMIAGVNVPYQKKLIVEGVGYRYEVKGDKVILALGFSHPVEMLIPKGIKVLVEKNIMTISGIDKEAVGGFAANIRAQKEPEPYKGKGIRYENEVVRRKQGKKSV